MPNFSGEQDEQIAKAVQAGELEKFGELVTRYEDRLKRYGRRFLGSPAEIEDIVQEVFLKAYKNFNSYDPGQKFSPWVYRIAHNEFVNTLRRNGHYPLSYFDPDLIFPVPQEPRRPERLYASEESKKFVEAALEKLAPKYKEPLVLFYFEDQEYKDIAEILHLPISTVGVRIKRGREALKKLIEQAGYSL